MWEKEEELAASTHNSCNVAKLINTDLVELQSKFLFYFLNCSKYMYTQFHPCNFLD